MKTNKNKEVGSEIASKRPNTKNPSTGKSQNSNPKLPTSSTPNPPPPKKKK